MPSHPPVQLDAMIHLAYSKLHDKHLERMGIVMAFQFDVEQIHQLQVVSSVATEDTLCCKQE